MFYLWVYFDERGKDFFLPSSRNWAGELSLQQRDTAWEEDVIIPIRALDNEWFIGTANGFHWADRGNDSDEARLEDGARFVMTNGMKIVGIVVSCYEKSNTVFVKYDFSRNARVLIGRSDQCDIQFDDQLISSMHGELVRGRDGASYYRDTSRNGSYINGYRLMESVRDLVFGDIITLTTGLKIIYMGDMVAVNSPKALRKVNLPGFTIPAEHRSDEGAIIPSSCIHYQRAPRLLTRPDETPVEIEPPLAKQIFDTPPLILTLGPSMTMILPMLAGAAATSLSSRGGNFMLAGVVMIGASSVLAVSWGVANFRYRRKHSILTERKRIALYQRYIQEMEGKLKAYSRDEHIRLIDNYLSVQQCMALPGDGTLRLWERMPSHQDFLCVRLGLGEVTFCHPIEIQTKRLSFIDDPLRDEAQRLLDTYGRLRNAPIEVNLRSLSVIGILGDENAALLAQSIIIQTAALHSYSDVKICVLYDEKNLSQWLWTRWLPHVFTSDDRQMRMSVGKPGAVHEILSHLDDILRMRAENLSEGKARSEDADQASPIPHYLVVCAAPELLDGQMILKRMLSQGLGFTLVLVARRMQQLPKECSVVVNTEANAPGIYTAEGDVIRLNYEYPEKGLIERFAKRIAPIRVSDLEENLAIPTFAPFLRTHGVRRVEKLDVWRYWNENMAYEGLRALIGLKAGGQPFILDISERFHGPHGLVAGTTGAGKSVLLQTYILSMALGYHPDQVRFILIDYKGGGMADPFRDLPHIAGLIDNLQSERTIFRALTSIQGEIKRRETVFKRVGVSNIDDYIRLYHDDQEELPIPHLIIIVDEFAELKKEKPEFMRELISASRVGRSVGIHLILATQKPSNSVDDEIWSNTRFHICLRVASRGDSMDMLKRPDAAYIKGMGRCYVQIGSDELFEQVQTLYSGGAYNPDTALPEEMPRLLNDTGTPYVIRAHKGDRSGVRETTEMDAVLGHICRVAQEHNISTSKWLWKEELRSVVFLHQIDAFRAACFQDNGWPVNDRHDIMACIGLADDVERQRHVPVFVDFTKERSHLFVGMPSSGKTTLIQTLVMSLCLRYSPRDLNIYLFSLSSRTLGCLSALPHVGGIVFEEETQEQLRLVNMLEEELNRRNKLFSAASTDSFLEYNRACDLNPGFVRVPAIVVGIDRVAQMRDIFSEEDLAKVFALIREGSGRGIFFAATALSMNEVPVRMQASFHNIALEMRERADYSEVLGVRVPLEMSDIARVKGRGLVKLGDDLMEMQVALFGKDESDVVRSQAIMEEGARLSEAWTGPRPAPIPRIPQDANWDDLLQASLSCAEGEHPLRLPMGYLILEGKPAFSSLDSQHAWMVIGPNGSGRTNYLRGISKAFSRRSAKILVVGGEAWNTWAEQMEASVFTPDSQELVEALLKLRNETTMARIGQKKQAMLVSKEEEERLVASFQPIVILVDDLEQAIGKLPGPIDKYFAEICLNAARYGIFLFASVSVQGIAQARTSHLFRALVQRQCGIVVGGKLSEYDIFTTQLSYAQRSQLLPKAEGWLVSHNTAQKLFLPRS